MAYSMAKVNFFTQQVLTVVEMAAFHKGTILGGNEVGVGSFLKN